MYGKIARLAGPKLAAFGSQLGKNFKRVYAPGGKLDYAEIGTSLLPDFIYGGMTAMNTPGDLGDKGIAFVTDVALGGVTSGALRGAAGARSRGIVGKNGKVDDAWRNTLGMAIEYTTPAVTMNYVHPISNGLIRAKHGGQSPLDVQMEQQEQQYRSQVAQQLLQELAANGMLR